MKKMFVGNLPEETSEEDLSELFGQFGRVRSVRVTRDVFSGRCRGFGFVEMEGHEARAAIAALDGRDFKGRPIRVNEERDDKGRGGRRGRR